MTGAPNPPYGTSGISAIGRIGNQNMLDSLTVRQSVLERVDAVENDDTWKGDLSEQYEGGASVGVKRKAVVYPTLAHEGRQDV